MLFVAALLAATIFGAYHRGERAATRKIALHAVSDSVKVATAAVDTAAHRADVAHGLDQSAGRRRSELRTHVELVDSQTVRIDDILMAAPPPMIQLVHRDDEKIAADSVTIGSLLAERAARQARDTVVQHREVLETASDDGGGISIKEIAVIAALLEGLHQLLRLVTR